MDRKFIIVLIVCILLLVSLPYVRAVTEGFSVADDLHTDFKGRQQKMYNPVAASLSAVKRDGALGDTTKDIVGSVLRVPRLDDTPTTVINDPYPVQGEPDGVKAMIAKCEAVKAVDCNKFDDPSFSRDCGICLDVGTNTEGQPHTGGLVMQQRDREYAVKYKRGNRIPDYKPTLGSCPTGRMVTTKAECIRVKREMDCQKGANYDLPECSQCSGDGSYFPVIGSTTRLPMTLYITGSGRCTINATGRDTVRVSELSMDRPYKYEMRASEGDSFSIMVEGGAGITYNMQGWPGHRSNTEDYVTMEEAPVLSGMLTGTTPGGAFTVDLRRLIINDYDTGRKPATKGTTQVNKVPATMMTSGYGRNRVYVSGTIPYTFVEADTIEGDMCRDGPYITKQSSAEFLASDPCFKKGSGPGRYNLECLQGLFLSNGCVEGGKGFPKDATTSAQLMVDNGGTALSLNDIADKVFEAAVKTATGMSKGQKLSLDDWSAASVFCTGRAITSPCDNANRDTGPLSLECLAYMWNNEGSGKQFGETYSTSSLASSLNQGMSMDPKFCQTEGTMAPLQKDGTRNEAAVQYWQKQGGVENVRAKMREIHRLANSDAPDSTKQVAIMQCYGRTLGDRPKQGTVKGPEVYHIGTYDKRKDQAEDTCRAAGGRLASQAEVQDALKAGANWCSTGWVKDNDEAMYPITTQLIQGCGNGSPGIKVWTPPGRVAGVNCYGVKPPQGTPNIWAFSETKWNNPLASGNGFKTDSQGDWIKPTMEVFGNNGTVSCNTYCNGLNGKPWNNELPVEWNGARAIASKNPDVGVDTAPGFRGGFSCTCERTGDGWSGSLPRTFKPVQGKVLGRIITSQNYTMSFSITPYSTVGNWGSILHFTSGGDCCNLPDRVPGIWFVPGGLGLHVRIGANNFGFDNNGYCPLNQKSTFRLDCVDNTVTLQVNGQKWTVSHPKDQRYGGIVTVYSADPWYQPANALIEDFTYTPF